MLWFGKYGWFGYDVLEKDSGVRIAEMYERDEEISIEDMVYRLAPAPGRDE